MDLKCENVVDEHETVCRVDMLSDCINHVEVGSRTNFDNQLVHPMDGMIGKVLKNCNNVFGAVE